MEKVRNAALLIAVVVFLPLLLVWVAIYLLAMVAWGAILRVWFWRAHASHGRSILFVYSNSPNWQSYIEENILPQIQDRAVVLNWSERRDWSSRHPWEERFFRRFAGDREFNPIAIVFRDHGRVATVRFYRAFRDYKHGNTRALDQAQSQLLELSGAAA